MGGGASSRRPTIPGLQADKAMANADNVLTAAARVTCQAAERGDLRELDALLPRLAGAKEPELRAWDFVLRAIRWSFDPSHDPTPDADKARRIAHAHKAAATIVARGCVVMERVAFHTFDRRLLAEWTALHEALLGDGADDDADSKISLTAARLWHRLLAGDTDGLDKAAEQLSDQAVRQKAAPEAIESTVIRALLALSAGALGEATELARLASRSAQAEVLPQHEYLANIVLARVRRYSERPHLALHILAALDRVTPRTWSGWIAWETLLAGGMVPAPAGDQTHAAVPSMLAARCLSGLLEAARAGNRDAFVSLAAKVEESSSVWPHLGREATALLAVLDPQRTDVPESIATWQRGQTATIPYGLHGVGIPQDSDLEAETATAYVLARPGERGRRFLSLGLALVHDARVLTRDSPSSGARTETGLAALALAGEGGDSRDGFFRSVYGFPFVSHRHQAVLDMLCHRMRTLLGSSGEIHRRGGDSGPGAESEAHGGAAAAPDGPSLSLSLQVAVVVPDMRCALPTADRVLRALATMGASSATAAADSLRMPLRTVQAVLQQLVAERACTLERDGRHVSYRIDDTTFTEVNLS